MKWPWPRFDPQLLGSQLSALPRPHQVAFCVATSERLFPNYVKFSGEEEWGHPEALRRALDMVWELLRGKQVSPTTLAQMSEEVLGEAPDPGEFRSDFASAALDAANAAAATLLCYEDGSAEHAVEVATYARDSVDTYIQMQDPMEYDDPAFEQRILNHPLMKREMALQEAQLGLLSSAPVLDESVLVQLRADTRGNLEPTD